MNVNGFEPNEFGEQTDSFQDSGTSPTELIAGSPDGAIQETNGEWAPEQDKYEYLIKETLPSGRVNLLVGPSGAGKTTWFLQCAEAWLAGEPILDKETFRPLVHVKHDCPKGPKGEGCDVAEHRKAGTILYIAADRGEKDTEETMDRVLGANSPLLTDKKYGFEWKSMLDCTQSQIFDLFRSRPEIKIVFVEGVAPLIEGGRLSDNAAVAQFLKSASGVADRDNIAMIFSVHSPKMKRGEEYKNPRDRILGAVAWGGYSSTVMLLTEDAPADVKDNHRTLLVLPRNHPSVQYHFEMNPRGRLAEAPSPETVQTRLVLLTATQPGVWYSRKQLLAMGEQLGMSTSTVDRHLKAFLESGKLIKDSVPNGGNWRERRYMQPPLAEALLIPQTSSQAAATPVPVHAAGRKL